MEGVLHPRLRNARNKLRWTDEHRYVGRPGPWGDCPCRKPGCKHVTGLGNPFSAGVHGPKTHIRFHEMLKNNEALRARIRLELSAPTIIVCWCDGMLDWCHGESYARLSDGESVDSIAADVARRFSGCV